MRLVHRLVYKETEESSASIKQAGVPASSSAGFITIPKIDDSCLGKLDDPKLNQMLIVDEVSRVYTQSEIDSADWIFVFPTWQQYSAADITTIFDFPCDTCWANKRQKKDIILSAEIKKAKKPFLKTHDLDELLVTSETREALENGPFRFSYRNICYKRSGSIANNMFQLILESLPHALVNPQSDFIEKTICPKCGVEYGILRQDRVLKMKGETLRYVKGGIYRTAEYFGAHALGNYFIVSRDFYQFLKTARLSQGFRIMDIVQLV